MNSIEIPQVLTPPRRNPKLERWKLTIAITGAVILAPMTAIVLLLVVVSVLPLFLLELPFLLTRAPGPAPAPRAPLPPQEMLPGAPHALPAPT
jgi:hypothetical protein